MPSIDGVVDTIQFSPSDSGYEAVKRITLTNLSALMNMYRQTADIKMVEDLPHLKRPKLKNDTRTIVEIEMPQAYGKFLLDVQERAKAIHAGLDPSEDNFLKITNDLRHATLDMRLIDPSISESEAGAKIAAVCDTTAAKYRETADTHGTQVIFADLGVPKGIDANREEISSEQAALDEELSAEDISVYERIKQGLIRRGIPANQIAFIHEAKNPQQRQKLFERVNNGEVRVIIGSTGKMGAGVNIQKHLAALHHLDCPWRPRDIEQREGRILRAGNENSEVEIFTYVTKDSFDANMWEKVALKKEMMDAFLRGDPSIREIEDFDSNETVDYDTIMNRGITDQRTKEIAELNTKQRVLTIERNIFQRSIENRAREKRTLEAKIPQIRQRIENIESDIADRIPTRGNAFRMKIGKKEYTDRAAAGKAFDELIQNFRSSANRKVGEIGGFNIILRAEDTLVNRGGVTETLNSRVFAQLSNRNAYTVEPTLRSIEHFVAQGVDRVLKQTQDELQRDETQLSVANDELAKPFPKQKELDEVTRRLSEINQSLSDTAQSSVPKTPEVFTAEESETETPETESVATETSAENPAESEPAPQLKNKSKGKWSTFVSAGNREALQALMHSQGTTVEIREDGTVVTPDGRELHDRIRVHKGRYKDKQESAAVERQPVQSREPEFESQASAETEIPAEIETPATEAPDETPNESKSDAGRKIFSKEDGNIEQGRKAILDAPDGTKIRVRWVSFGDNSQNDYVISGGKFQHINENGYRDGNALKLNSANVKKYFGQNGVQKIELNYPEQAQESPAEIETKKAAFDGAFTSDGRLKNPWQARQIFEEKINPLRTSPFVNKATGITAQISKKGVGKLVSDAALRKSVANGYTEKQHFEAAMKIKQLFEDAWLAEEREDKHQQQDVISIKYFHCNTEVDGETAVARMLAKETTEHGHRLYTIELQELNKPAELENRTGTDSPAGSEGSSLRIHIADSRGSEEPSTGNIPQTKFTDNGKTQQQRETAQASPTETETPTENSFTLTENEEPEVPDHTAKVTLKTSTNGSRIFYNSAGKRISESDALFLDVPFGDSSFESKFDRADKLKDAYRAKDESTDDFNEAKDKNYGYFTYMRYRTGNSLKGVGRHFKTLEDAIGCAKYFFQNRGNLRTDDIEVFKGHSIAQGNSVFSIDADGKGTFTDEAAEAVNKNILTTRAETPAQEIPAEAETPANSEILSEREIRDIMFENDPEKLDLDERLKNALYKKYPAIKEAVDVWLETGGGAKPYDRRAARNWTYAKRQLSALLQHLNRDFNNDTLTSAAASSIYDVWSTKKLHGKVSNKTAQLDAKAKESFKNFSDGKITAQELYRQIGTLLYPEKFSAAESETKKATPVAINETISFTGFREAREIFRQKILALKDVPITNKATGIVAQIGKDGRRKPLSSVAIEKSLANGYSAEQHFAAALNIKELYENAQLAETRPGMKATDDPKTLRSIKIFSCVTNIMGQEAEAKITVKESFEAGHRIYTVELQELNKPAGLANRTGTDSPAGSEDSTHMYHVTGSRSAEEPSAENIPQTKFAGNDKSEKMSAETVKTFVESGEFVDHTGEKYFGAVIKFDEFFFDFTAAPDHNNYYNNGHRLLPSVRKKLSKLAQEHHGTEYDNSPTKTDGTQFHGLTGYRFDNAQARDSFATEAAEIARDEVAKQKQRYEELLKEISVPEDDKIIQAGKYRTADGKPFHGVLIPVGSPIDSSTLTATEEFGGKEIYNGRTRYDRITSEDSVSVVGSVVKFKTAKARNQYVANVLSGIHQNLRQSLARDKFRDELKRQERAEEKALLNTAAQNPDTANAMRQLGAQVQDGKVTAPDDQTHAAVVTHVEHENKGVTSPKIWQSIIFGFKTATGKNSYREIDEYGDEVISRKEAEKFIRQGYAVYVDNVNEETIHHIGLHSLMRKWAAKKKIYLLNDGRLNEGYGSNEHFKDHETLQRIQEILSRYHKDELTPQEAYAEMSDALKINLKADHILPANLVKYMDANGIKHSLRGRGDTAIKNFLAPEDLTEQQKILQRLGKDLGVRVVFFSNDNGDFHGAHAGNISYLNANSKLSLPQVFWHEAAHWLKANNPDLHTALVEAANITDAQRRNYLEETERTDLTTADEIDEEIIADQMEDVLKREGFLSDIGRKDKSLLERIAAWLQDMLSKFREYFRNPQGKLTNEQAQRMANEFGRMARNLVDQDGKKIFRYNSQTHTLELATGEKLPSVDTTTKSEVAQTKKALVELARAAWDDKDFNGKVSFRPSKKFRDKVQELFGHDVTTVFITGSDVRHIKKHHGEHEEKRGQIDMTPDSIAEIYDVVNDFDIARKEETDKKGNQSIMVIRNDNGASYTLLFEREKEKAQVKTAFKRKNEQMLDVTSPKPNVRNDSARSFSERIPQSRREDNAAAQFGGRFEGGRLSFGDEQDATAYTQHTANMERGEFKYSFAGERALTANHEKLATARRMDEAGKDKFAIYNSTGWVKGKDGKWRFEIPDNRDQINLKKLVAVDKKTGRGNLGKKFRLDEIYDNPQLYAAYPKLREIVVMSKDFDDSSVYGETQTEGDNGIEISLNFDLIGHELRQMKKTLVHEIQHVIQSYEDFAFGGSAANIKGQLRDGIKKAKRTIRNLPEDSSQRARMQERIDELQEAASNTPNTFEEKYGLYWRLGGEQEAREVEDRLYARNKFTPIIHTSDALIVFGGKEYAMARVDFSDGFSDNDAVSQRVFDKYLTDGIMKMVRDVVAEEIGEHVDISKMSDPVARDEARDSLPCIKELLTKYNLRSIQSRPDYKNHFAARIEYARRCFDNDERIRNESSESLDRNEGQRGIGKTRSTAVSGSNARGTGRQLRGSDVGVSRSVSGGKSAAYNHFLKLYDEESNRKHSDRQGAFSVGGNARFAGNGKLDKMFEAAREISDEELTAQEHKWVKFGADLGVQVKWIDGHRDLKGALKDGVIYINRRANENVEKTFWHEQFHLTAATNPELYRDLLKYFTGSEAFTGEQLQNYRDKTGRHNLSNEEVIEEILSDNFGQIQKRVQLLREMSANNSSLAKRFVAWLKNLAEKVAALFRNPEGGMTTKQRDAFLKGISELGDKVQIGTQPHTGIKFSALDKIKNFMTGRENERARNQMRRLLEELSGYRIRTGHFAEGIDGVANDLTKVIRTQAYDYEKILPAVGKGIAEKLNLTPSEQLNNYIANWLQDGAPNDTSKAALNFQRAMRNADDMYRTQLLEVQEIFAQWNRLAPEEIVRQRIEYDKEKKPLTERAKEFFNGFYEDFVEELYPIKQLRDQFEADTGKKLKAEEDPFVLLRNYRGMAGRAKIMVEEDAAAIDALKLSIPKVNFSKSKTIRMILDSVNALNDTERRKQFSDYILACAVKDLHNLNKEIFAEQESLEQSIERLEDALDDMTDREEIAETKELIAERKERLVKLGKRIYATPFSEEVCDGTIAKYKNEYGAAQRDMVEFNHTLLDIMVDSGVLSEKQRDEHVKRYPNYAPMFRAFDENEDVSFGDSLERRKGSTRDVIDPLESIIRNTYSFIRRAEKNKAKLLLANMSRMGGTGLIFDEVSAPRNDIHTTITFYENGEKKYLETDRAIVKAVNNLNVSQMSWFMKFLRVGTMLLRNFATVYNPAFALRNLVMDGQNALLYSKYGLFSPADFVRGFLSVWRKDADY